MALNSAFFISNVQAVERELATNTGGKTYECSYRDSSARISENNFDVCKSVVETGLVEQEYKPTPRAGFGEYQPIEDASCPISTVVVGSIYSISCTQKFGSTRNNDDGSSDTDNFTVRANGTIKNPEQSDDTWQCLNPNFPNGPIEQDGYYYCEADEQPEIDEDCPARTQSDPFVYGITNSQTTVCYDAGNGRQCAIQTNADGSYYLPVSYSTQEPVTCRPDPIDPIDPIDPVDPPVDVTPAPDPIDPPENTDDSDKTEVLDATNQINDNLNAINSNLNTGISSNNERLDRLALETQIGNELLASNNTDAEISNELLFDINENIKGQNSDNSEVITELKKLNETTFTGEFDPNNSSSFYEPVYENGFQGVWDDKSQAFNQTGFFKFLEQFKFSSGGIAPDMTICFDVLVNFGCKTIDPNWSLIMPFLRVCIFLTTVFVCRLIIFGG